MVDVNNFSYVNENFGAEMGRQYPERIFPAAGTQKSNGSMPYVLGLFPCIVQGKSQQEIRRRVKEGNEEFEAKLQERYPAGGMKLSAGICFLSGKEFV